MGGPNKKFRYCVIKLKKAGEPWLDPYICVPYSWLRLHKKSVIVKYPQESKSLTTYRVKHCEVSQPNWLTFGADIKYKTDSYVDAQMCLRKLLQGYREKNAQQDNKPTTSNETGKFDVKIFGTQNKRNEIQKSNNSDDDSTESEDVVSESQVPNQLTTKTIDKQHKTVSYKKVNGNKVVPKLIIKKVKPIKYKFKSKLVVETLPKSAETGQNKSSTGQNTSDSEAANNATDNETASGPLNPRTIAIVNLWKTIQDQISFIEQLEESDKQINGIVDKMSTSIKAVDTLKDLIDQLEALEDEIEDEEEEEEEATKVESGTGQLESDIIQESEKEDKVEETEEEIEEEKEEEIDEEEKEEEEIEEEEKEQEEEEIVVEKKEEKEAEKVDDKEEEKQDEKEEETGEDGTQNENPQTINLPPEYDENDSRWTLKYKSYSSELTELEENSRIYVNFEKLAAIVDKCRNQKQMARNLLSEVFTKNALSVCKFPQPISVPSHRPDLDIGGIKAILDYVQKHTALVNWPYVSPKIIKLSLRGKLSYAHKKFKRTGRFT